MQARIADNLALALALAQSNVPRMQQRNLLLEGPELFFVVDVHDPVGIRRRLRPIV